MPKILLVEENHVSAASMQEWLSYDKYMVEIADTGAEALRRLENFNYDAVVLGDVRDIFATEVLDRYRQSGGQVPILMLGGRTAASYKEYVFDLGCDDYVTRPFEMIEVAARLRALMRRQKNFLSDVLRAGIMTVNTSSYRVFVGKNEAKLAPLEFNLLVFLMKNPDRVFSPDALAKSVWTADASPSIESIRTCVKSLRQKTRFNNQPSIIKTVHGAGYFLDSGMSIQGLSEPDEMDFSAGSAQTLDQHYSQTPMRPSVQFSA